MTDLAITGAGALTPISGESTAPTVTVVDQSDAAFFNNAMEGHAAGTNSGNAPSGPSMAEQVLEKLHAFSDRAAERGEELERLVFRATETLNPLDMVQANRMMSDYYLENMMTAKMIGQSTQAVERLTNLS